MALTFSIMGRCERTGMLGMAIATAEIAVGSRCVHVRPSVGAVISQAASNPALGHLGLNLLAVGYTVQKTLDELVRSDPYRQLRQIACLDQHGHGAGWTGDLRPWAAHRIAPNVVIAVNTVVGPEVGEAMLAAFTKTRPDGALWEQLLAALEAGHRAGGEARGEHSAALYVVDRTPYPVVDLRVDSHAAAIAELRRITDVYAPLIPYYRLRPHTGDLPLPREWLAQQQAQGSIRREPYDAFP
jgi:uncharacterized Ntn-hydrolase superfamily protein